MSSAVDDDVAETVAEGREHLGTMLSTAQTHLQKVFILFVVGLIGTIYVLRAFVWQRLKADLNVNPAIDIVAITPFEVILLQVKIGLVVGVVLTIPPLIYYSRDSLRRRGRWPDRRPSSAAADPATGPAAAGCPGSSTPAAESSARRRPRARSSPAGGSPRTV